MIISSPLKRLGHFSSSALSITLRSGWLHSPAPAVLDAHPMVLTSSGCWVLLLQKCLTHSLPMIAQWCQALAALHENFMYSKPVPLGWFLYMNKSSCTTKSNLDYLWNTPALSFIKCYPNTLPRWCWFLHSSWSPLILEQHLSRINCISSVIYSCL